MASFYGTDASASALAARYVSVLPKSSFQHTSAGLAASLDRLCSTELWRRANVVLLPASDLSSAGMARVAARVISDGKRLGVSARWDAQAGADDSCATKQPRVDFLEAEGIDDVLAPSKRVVPPSASGWPEGATAGFSCNELLGAICVVPGLVFDSEGFFVGQDDGAYAHFLRLFPGYKVALVDGLQVSSNPLPHGEGDVAVDYLVTPGSVWRCHS